jgi:hypothetical protein
MTVVRRGGRHSLFAEKEGRKAVGKTDLSHPLIGKIVNGLTFLPVNLSIGNELLPLQERIMCHGTIKTIVARQNNGQDRTP